MEGTIFWSEIIINIKVFILQLSMFGVLRNNLKERGKLVLYSTFSWVIYYLWITCKENSKSLG